jgi:tetratricopeptide (TPR) repeat protein
MRKAQLIRINYSLLGWTVVVLALVALIAFGVQVRQQRRIVTDLEKQVDLLLSEEKYEDAFSKLGVLSMLKPGDLERKLQLALCADKTAGENSKQIQNAVGLNLAALAICQADSRLEANTPIIRRRLVQRMAQLGRFEDAIDQINRLVDSKVDFELQRYFTICKVRLWLDGRGYESASGDSADLPNWFATLVSMPPVDLLVKTHVEIPEDFEIAGLLVDLCLGDPAKLAGSFLAGDTKEALKTRAQSIVERLVNKRPNDPFSWLLRYEISSRDNKFGLSEADIERAVELGDQNQKVLLVAGKLYLERAKRVIGVSSEQLRQQFLKRSLVLFEAARKLNPLETQAYLNIGEIYGSWVIPTKPSRLGQTENVYVPIE